MFEIEQQGDHEIGLVGRFDASQVEKARLTFEAIHESTVVDLARLDYISSAGLAVLLFTQKRLMESGQRLRLVNLKHHVRDILSYAGFGHIFQMD